ncbi:hypothetical protein PHLCEN_2v13409 [Hermanssonia centrifuga]|uniref:Alanine dehydrogenase/pyridine nucleotide transhydrogenase N-terminal domain-containing protein n=1 Tax=Hermanssonia centrifuga TaxID=98765 RepID=A0A2R6NEF0_9APHY|nr:hypothetical protein PHLCEN_2v13409 [Hermanssonia centrifuga]
MLRALTIGIRREDPLRIWERRCPLSPHAVHALLQEFDGLRVLVQPCERRIWTMDEFLQAGALPHPTLAPAHIVLGIKETPIPELTHLVSPLPHGPTSVPRTHMMFSHTHKGQSYNMALLDNFVSRPGLTEQFLKPRLIDYELLKDREGKRTVGFGWFAGVAGALESLAALAHAHLELGIATPFLASLSPADPILFTHVPRSQSTPRPHTHPSLPSLLSSLHTLVGDRIAHEGTPRVLGPIVIGVTG